MKKCWTLLPSEIESGAVVDLLVTLNPDGSVVGVPSVLKANDAATGMITRAGQMAVVKCGPYTLPKEKYDTWKQIDLELNSED